ncbi:MAG: riboflavin biosynthesis protein RibF [Oscillospiraceae bacterium]|nr:riboflavin biosynthesis protein RibF [Oscillospiraceae bacterium]
MYVLALGFFDGVHIGHAALLDHAAAVAERLGLDSCALTFDAHPRQVISGKPEPLINTVQDREYLLRRHVKNVITLRFDERVMRMAPGAFIRETIKPLAAHVVAGADFRFGYNGTGTSEYLAAECKKLGIGCDVVPIVSLDGVPAGSTLIRRLIAKGNMEAAVRLLGHPHILSGPVEHGRRLGASIGAPTVNLNLPDGIVRPAYGVYLTRVFARGRLLNSVTNTGVRPTVAENGRPNAETTIFGFSGDLYGEHIRVEFLKFMRPEKRFCSVEALRSQIAGDVEAALAEHSILQNNR